MHTHMVDLSGCNSCYGCPNFSSLVYDGGEDVVVIAVDNQSCPAVHMQGTGQY